MPERADVACDCTVIAEIIVISFLTTRCALSHVTRAHGQRSNLRAAGLRERAVQGRLGELARLGESSRATDPRGRYIARRKLKIYIRAHTRKRAR